MAARLEYFRNDGELIRYKITFDDVLISPLIGTTTRSEKDAKAMIDKMLARFNRKDRLKEDASSFQVTPSETNDN